MTGDRGLEEFKRFGLQSSKKQVLAITAAETMAPNTEYRNIHIDDASDTGTLISHDAPSSENRSHIQSLLSQDPSISPQIRILYGLWYNDRSRYDPADAFNGNTPKWCTKGSRYAPENPIPKANQADNTHLSPLKLSGNPPKPNSPRPIQQYMSLPPLIGQYSNSSLRVTMPGISHCLKPSITCVDVNEAHDSKSRVPRVTETQNPDFSTVKPSIIPDPAGIDLNVMAIGGQLLVLPQLKSTNSIAIIVNPAFISSSVPPEDPTPSSKTMENLVQPKSPQEDVVTAHLQSSSDERGSHPGPQNVRQAGRKSDSESKNTAGRPKRQNSPFSDEKRAPITRRLGSPHSSEALKGQPEQPIPTSLPISHPILGDVDHKSLKDFHDKRVALKNPSPTGESHATEGGGTHNWERSISSEYNAPHEESQLADKSLDSPFLSWNPQQKSRIQSGPFSEMYISEPFPNKTDIQLNDQFRYQIPVNTTLQNASASFHQPLIPSSYQPERVLSQEGINQSIWSYSEQTDSGQLLQSVRTPGPLHPRANPSAPTQPGLFLPPGYFTSPMFYQPGIYQQGNHNTQGLITNLSTSKEFDSKQENAQEMQRGAALASKKLENEGRQRLFDEENHRRQLEQMKRRSRIEDQRNERNEAISEQKRSRGQKRGRGAEKNQSEPHKKPLLETTRLQTQTLDSDHMLLQQKSLSQEHQRVTGNPPTVEARDRVDGTRGGQSQLSIPTGLASQASAAQIGFSTPYTQIPQMHQNPDMRCFIPQMQHYPPIGVNLSQPIPNTSTFIGLDPLVTRNTVPMQMPLLPPLFMNPAIHQNQYMMPISTIEQSLLSPSYLLPSSALESPPYLLVPAASQDSTSHTSGLNTAAYLPTSQPIALDTSSGLYQNPLNSSVAPINQSKNDQLARKKRLEQRKLDLRMALVVESNAQKAWDEWYSRKPRSLNSNPRVQPHMDARSSPHHSVTSKFADADSREGTQLAERLISARKLRADLEKEVDELSRTKPRWESTKNDDDWHRRLALRDL